MGDFDPETSDSDRHIGIAIGLVFLFALCFFFFSLAEDSNSPGETIFIFILLLAIIGFFWPHYSMIFFASILYSLTEIFSAMTKPKRSSVHIFSPDAEDIGNYKSLDDFAALKNISKEKIIKMLNEGFYEGRQFDGQWLVHKVEFNNSPPNKAVHSKAKRRRYKYNADYSDIDNYVPIEEFSTYKQLDVAVIVKRIEEGFYQGRQFDSQWYVHKYEFSL